MKKILIFFSVFILTGCVFYDEYKMPTDVLLKEYNKDIVVYSDKTVIDLIKEKNVEIINAEEKLNASKTGVKNVTIKYKYNKRNYKYDVSYTVVDTEAPKIIYSKDYEYLYEGNEVDLCESIIYIDNYDRKPKCKISGEYDFNIPGTYELVYEISDKDENIKKANITLDVLKADEEESLEEDYEEEIIEEEEEEEKLDFSYIVDKYKTDERMIGIDVSRWQGDIDFEKVKKAGCEFVIIRMAVSNGKDDEIGLDSKYKENIKNAKKAGLKVGVYVYTAASTKDEVISQAKYVRKILNKEKLDFPIAYDFESWNEIKDFKMNTHDLISLVNEFYKIVNKDNYDVMLYSSKFYLENIWPNNNYKTWLAHYVDETTYDKDYILWQMSSIGKIDGIDGNVDIDIYYKNKK